MQMELLSGVLVFPPPPAGWGVQSLSDPRPI